jgi:hypothetical protein
MARAGHCRDAVLQVGDDVAVHIGRMALGKLAGWPGVATLAHAPGVLMFVGERLRHQRSRL